MIRNFRFSRRTLWTVVALIAAAAAVSSHAAASFSRDDLLERAKMLAGRPYQPRDSRVPASLAGLSYDDYRMIQFDNTRSWWGGEKLPFLLQFFHPGFVHDRTVQIAELNDGRATPIAFDPALFRYEDGLKLPALPADMGFSGFRVHYPSNPALHFGEVAVFQGGSYFRAIGLGQRYGLSARGLAIDTSEPHGEEFPVFEEFWVERPALGAGHVIVHALMDSRSATGVFRFLLRPGSSTTMDIQASVFVRAGSEGRTLGVAPLTSMFWHGESSGTVNNDYRPEVHDSDGLMIQRGNGEWVWRPLSNPAKTRAVAFGDENPKGFGLVQRDRRFSSYEDLEACYHLRPSAWVEPLDNWGKGQIRLVEIPTPDETNDNIVAFWVPERSPQPGEALNYAYRLHWFMETGEGAIQPPGGRAIATRLGRSRTHQPDLQRFVIDFEGPGLPGETAIEGLEVVLDVGPGAERAHQGLQWNPFAQTWRVALALRPDGTGRPVELRCFLRRHSEVLTETWSYLWQP